MSHIKNQKDVQNNDTSEQNAYPIPNTDEWQPRDDKVTTLNEAFLKRCTRLEEKILLKIKHEKETNLDNYDSGTGIEEILRKELRQLLPDRYFVTSGVINDRDGKSAGDSEIIIFNHLWFPAIKTGAIEDSRRFHFPIEGIYAIAEVKQSIDFKILDKAMKKLVICHRLNRPATYANRIVENADLDGCSHGKKNPLYSAIIATSLKIGTDLDALVDRFFHVNKTLKRFEVIRCLCVLGEGTVTWAYYDDSGTAKPALFMKDDLQLPIFPAYHKTPFIPSAFSAFVTDLLMHLYHSVLPAEDIAAIYGSRNPRTLLPNSSEISLLPKDEEES